MPLGDVPRVRVAGLRVGTFTSLPPLEPTREAAAAVESALEALRAGGGAVRTVEIPDSARVFEFPVASTTGLFASLNMQALTRRSTD